MYIILTARHANSLIYLYQIARYGQGVKEAASGRTDFNENALMNDYRTVQKWCRIGIDITKI